MTNQTSNTLNWYTGFFKAWRVADLGPKPTAEMLDSIHGLSARPGKQALAISMSLRDCGVTGAQIVMACGAPQLNKMRGFIADGLLKREPAPADAKGHTVYKCVVTAKGVKRIETAVKRAADLAAKQADVEAAKPVKKAASKPRKAKGKAKVTEPAQVTPEPATADSLPVPSPVDAPVVEAPQS